MCMCFLIIGIYELYLELNCNNEVLKCSWIISIELIFMLMLVGYLI